MMSFISMETALLLLPGLIIGLTFHEAGHALSAHWLGDSYAKRLGRVSLNPLRHLSLLGTLALFLLGFGWAKPVPVNTYNFRRPRFYFLLTSLAGPATNILLAAVALGLLYLRPPGMLGSVLVPIYLMNVILAVINLLPIPPLDGSSIWPCLFPGLRSVMSGKSRMVWLVALLILFRSDAMGSIIRPVIGFVFGLLPG